MFIVLYEEKKEHGGKIYLKTKGLLCDRQCCEAGAGTFRSQPKPV